MKIGEMILKLTALQYEIGDVELLITDGHDARCYAGKYSVEMFEDIDGTVYADIGIGGCLDYKES